MENRGLRQVSSDRDPATASEGVSQPERAHLHSDERDDGLEATELRERRPSRPASRRIVTAGEPPRHWFDPAKQFWRHHIRLSVPHVDCRDHLANERTFLSYVRTSAAFSVMGVIVAQFWRLQHSPTPDAVFGYYVVSKPLSAILQCSALITVSLGTVRYFQQQSLMARGKVRAGGWEVLATMAVAGLIGIETRKDLK